MLPVKDENGWSEWSRHVRLELIRLNICCEKIDSKLNNLIVSHAVLKVKAGLWGALSGLAAALIPVLFMLMRGKPQ